MLSFGSSRLVNVTTREIAGSGFMLLFLIAESVNAVFTILTSVPDSSTDDAADPQHHMAVL